MIEGRRRLFRVYIGHEMIYEDPIFAIMMDERYRLGIDQKLVVNEFT